MMKPLCKATLQRHFSLLIFHYWVGIYHPQTKFAKVMFSQVSVCPRGASVQGWSLSRGGLVQGVSVSGSLSRRFLSRRHLPPPARYGNVRVVRILLECILVNRYIQAQYRKYFVCDYRRNPLWTDRHNWKHYLVVTSFMGKCCGIDVNHLK